MWNKAVYSDDSGESLYTYRHFAKTLQVNRVEYHNTFERVGRDLGKVDLADPFELTDVLEDASGDVGSQKSDSVRR